MVAVCKDHADLKITRVIPRSKFDFPMAIPPVVAVRQHLGREPLHTDVWKTDGHHRAAKIHRATGGNGQRGKPPVCLQQSQIIGRVHAYRSASGAAYL